MQSNLNAPDSGQLWRQLAPHLEAAMSRLAERDRTLLALRFYENKTGAEAAALLGIREAAAHKRTARALEKLRSFFAKRGVDSTAAAIAEQISANSDSSCARGAGENRDRRGDCQRRDGFAFNLNPHQRSIENYGMDKGEDGNHRCSWSDLGYRRNHHPTKESFSTDGREKQDFCTTSTLIVGCQCQRRGGFSHESYEGREIGRFLYKPAWWNRV